MNEFRVRCPHYNGRGELLTVSEQFVTAAEFEVSQAGDLVFLDEEDRVIVAFGRNHWRNVCEFHDEAPLVRAGRGVDELAELEGELQAFGAQFPQEDMVDAPKAKR